MRLIVFDLDHTLLTINSSFQFGSFLYRQHVFSFCNLLKCLSDYARYKWLGMSIYDLHMRIFNRLFKGKHLTQISHYVDQFLIESLPSILYHSVVQRLKQAQAQGNSVLILSSSPDFIVKKIARYFHVSQWAASVYDADSKGRLSAISSIMQGQDKANYVIQLINKVNIDLSAVTVYSDSYLDLPLLKIAGKAIAVRPDSYLKKICLEKGWEILEK